MQLFCDGMMAAESSLFGETYGCFKIHVGVGMVFVCHRCMNNMVFLVSGVVRYFEMLYRIAIFPPLIWLRGLESRHTC